MKLTYSLIIFGILFSIVTFVIGFDAEYHGFHFAPTYTFNPASIPFILAGFSFLLLGIKRLIGQVDLTNVNEYSAKDLIQGIL